MEKEEGEEEEEEGEGEEGEGKREEGEREREENLYVMKNIHNRKLSCLIGFAKK